MNPPRSISNSPTPVLETEVVGAGSSQTTRAEQQRPARISEPVPAEQRSQIVSSFPGLQPGENSPVSTDPAPRESRTHVTPGTLSKLKRSSSALAEKTQNKFEALPNEVFQNILGLAVSPGSRADMLLAMNNLANVSKSFEAQIEAGPLPNLNRLTDLRTLAAYRRLQGESELKHAVRLIQQKPSLTPEEAVFVATGNFNPELVNNVSTTLELQPAEVQGMIAVLKEQIQKETYEPNLKYAGRLKVMRPDLTAKHAAMAIQGYASSTMVKEMSELLEFQTSEVQAKVADIRIQYPIGSHEDDISLENYGLRLMEHNHLPEDLASLASMRRAYPGRLSRLLEREQREAQRDSFDISQSS